MHSVAAVVVDEVVVACAAVVGACVVVEARVLVPGALVRVAAEEAVWQAVEALLVRASTAATLAVLRIDPQEAVRTAPTFRVAMLEIWGIATRTLARAIATSTTP